MSKSHLIRPIHLALLASCCLSAARPGDPIFRTADGSTLHRLPHWRLWTATDGVRPCVQDRRLHADRRRRVAGVLPCLADAAGLLQNTTKGQGAPAANNYGDNGNFAMDQISLFLAGRITDYAGGFVQGTFNGIDSSFHLDNTDLRLTKPFDVGDTDLRLGVDLNNGPTVQDPFNSTYAWGYPYVASAWSDASGATACWPAD